MLERHIQSIVVAIILMLLTWNTRTTNNNSILLARIDENIKNRQIQIDKLDHRVNVNRDKTLELEKRLDKFEAGYR